MKLNQRLFDSAAPLAQRSEVRSICLGLGYTAVTLDNGDVGIAYTYFDHKTGCCLAGEYCDYEGRPAMDLLCLIMRQGPLERSMALALINALYQPQLAGVAPDPENRTLFETLGIGAGTRLAMVGLFKPLVKVLQDRGARVEVIDEFRGIGDRKQFHAKLSDWADVVLITATTILNSSFEEIMAQVNHRAGVALLGPSTPMNAEVFAPMGIRALAGIAINDADAAAKVVRHGLGTRHLHRHSSKITLTLQGSADAGTKAL